MRDMRRRRRAETRAKGASRQGTSYTASSIQNDQHSGKDAQGFDLSEPIMADAKFQKVNFKEAVMSKAYAKVKIYNYGYIHIWMYVWGSLYIFKYLYIWMVMHACWLVVGPFVVCVCGAWAIPHAHTNVTPQNTTH